MSTLCIELNNGEFLDSKVVRVEKGWNLRFTLGSGLSGKAVRVRICESEVEYFFTEMATIGDLDSRISWDYHCDQFGAFCYEFFDVDGNALSPVGRGFFCVVPEWRIAGGEKRLTLNGLSVVTHLAKLLGPLGEWEDRLMVAREAGYNVIHLTPVHRLGISNSSYSISEYDQLNPSFEANFAALKHFVDKMEREWHMLTIQDVVWNHAAKNAKWLQDHPECAFNCANSTHLRPAYVLDRALQQFSREIGEGKWAHEGIPTVIQHDSHLSALRHVLSSKVFPSIRLHEFFQADVESLGNEFRSYISANIPSNKNAMSDVESIGLISDPNFCRFGCTVNLSLAAVAFLREPGGIDSAAVLGADESICRFVAHLNRINGDARRTVDGHIATAIDAIIGHVHYERVAENGPRKGAVTLNQPLVTNYFLHPPEFGLNDWKEDEKLAFSSRTAVRLMACNGWVMNADPLANFAEWPCQVYLRREGLSLSVGLHAPLLGGITPIHVAEYLLKAARHVRRDLYVVAELFTGSEKLDNLFVNRLGITSLIREAQNANDSHEQGRFVYRYGGDPVGAFHCKSTRPAPWAVAHALLYDQTHDNPSPAQKRTPYDFVPTAAMCSISGSACGTVRGYDEFVAHNIDVVNEDRMYRKWSEFTEDAKGMIRARRLLNDLHVQLSTSGYSEIFVDQVNEDVVAVTRHNPNNHESVLLIAHTCFSSFKWTPNCRAVQVADDITGILFELKTVEHPQKDVSKVFQNDDGIISGLHNFYVECFEKIDLDNSEAIEVVDGAIKFKLFLSGSAIALKIKPTRKTKIACEQIDAIISNETARTEARKLLEQLSFLDFNYLLFRCEPEERAEFDGNAAYEVPNLGKLVFCGLMGIRTVLQRIQRENDLGHPFCENIRRGNWLFDYSVARLNRRESLRPFASLLAEAFCPLVDVPHFLRPSLVEGNGGEMASLSAGLPHFAEGIWRNWGRDTFIALPGLLLLTGRHAEARTIILAFAATLRHGLIPNLLAEGKAPRYNCRDAVWFWLVAIIRYTEKVENGEAILGESVLRLYPTDETEYGEETKMEPLSVTMFEALSRHFQGIAFRERNAGPRIDEHMRDEGFNVRAFIDEQSGLVFGGNRWNCGTWMDKMGSSERAGNRGEPASPRDGAAVELQGLALRVARGLDRLCRNGAFPYNGMKGKSSFLSWAEWATKIQRSFEEHFFVDDKCHSEFVNRRFIVKDSFGASLGYADFQLRPNFCIALDASPDILPPEKAWSALEIAGKVLAENAPYGICTLDPKDWAYCGYYNNDDDGTNKISAKGWNYHQGPEWLWVAGCYMSAKLKVASLMYQNSGDATEWMSAVNEVRTRLFALEHCLQKSEWASLPELTNRGGAFCTHSCPAQAWSVGCVLETLDTFDGTMAIINAEGTNGGVGDADEAEKR
uniref:4-alpha-glucanotransferase n=1 Tax=Globodera rostochiensis TaxID=31243 RepID=A0A914HEY4_GLORO